jgi:hypothetical protein
MFIGACADAKLQVTSASGSLVTAKYSAHTLAGLENSKMIMPSVWNNRTAVNRGFFSCVIKRLDTLVK